MSGVTALLPHHGSMLLKRGTEPGANEPGDFATALAAVIVVLDNCKQIIYLLHKVDNGQESLRGIE